MNRTEVEAVLMPQRQWVISLIVVLVCLAAVIGVVPYLDTYCS